MLSLPLLVLLLLLLLLYVIIIIIIIVIIIIIIIIIIITWFCQKIGERSDLDLTIKNCDNTFLISILRLKKLKR